MSMLHNEILNSVLPASIAKQEIALQDLLAKGSHISTQWTPNSVTYKNLGAVGQEKQKQKMVYH